MPGQMRPFIPTSPGDDDGSPSGYEALFISAMIIEGSFTPERWHVSDEDIVGWPKLWAFCKQYQAQAGEAPPPHLIRRAFPEFAITPKVNIDWAAGKVLEDSWARQTRIRIGGTLTALADGDLPSAYAALEHLPPPRAAVREPMDVFTVAVGDDAYVDRIETPYPTLQRLTHGGLEPGDFMLLGSRFGHGKTHIATRFAARAAEVGWNVGILSYEMPARQYQMRILRKLCGPRRRLFDRLGSEDEIEVKKAIAEIAESTPGTVRIFDPSYGTINRVSMVAELCADYDFVILDHMGLMANSKGARAIEDWRVFAEISNVVRETTLAAMTPLLGVVQINRQGEHPGRMMTPRGSEIAGTDALGQDAPVVVTMARLSKRIIMFTAIKVREGPTGTWYARFDPTENRWEEIDKQLALEISADDDALDD